MQTLLLCSSGQFITSYNIDSYLPKKLVDCSIAYIITASGKVSDTGYIERHRKKMKELGFRYTEIDIAGKQEEDLRKTLAGYDIVLVEGGNTFYLLQAVRASGFERILKELLPQGVVYIGISAGSYITCPSIIMATYSRRPKDRCGMTNFTGMNLVPFVLKAHYTPDMLPELMEIQKTLQYPLRVLNDDQAILLQDKKVTLLGGGEEMILGPGTGSPQV